MTEEEKATAEHAEEEWHEERPPPLWVDILTWCVRAFARLWIISMMLAAAALAGIIVYQHNQSRSDLNELRRAPGEQPYAVVAYRRELARQIHLYRRNWRNMEAVPAPPSRPLLLEEIDFARARNSELRRPPQPQGMGPVAPPR